MRDNRSVVVHPVCPPPSKHSHWTPLYAGICRYRTQKAERRLADYSGGGEKGPLRDDDDDGNDRFSTYYPLVPIIRPSFRWLLFISKVISHEGIVGFHLKMVNYRLMISSVGWVRAHEQEAVQPNCMLLPSRHLIHQVVTYLMLDYSCTYPTYFVQDRSAL